MQLDLVRKEQIARRQHEKRLFNLVELVVTHEY